MFKGFQQALGQGRIPQRGKTVKISPILTAKQLLVDPKRHLLVNKFRKLMDLSISNYALYGEPLLRAVAEFVQSLPGTNDSYFSEQGGFLNHGLERTVKSLERCRAYFLPGGSAEDALTEPQTLWAYVLFSASLLYGIGRIVTDFNINITDKNGHILKKWQPLLSSMNRACTQASSYYTFEFENKYEESYRRRLSLLLARQLMPEAGFNWLASNHEALAVWLALLDDDLEGSGTWGLILSQTNALVIHHYLNTPQPGVPGAHFPDFNVNPQQLQDVTPANATDKDATAIAKAFTDWINKQIQSGNYKFNQGPLYEVSGGILITNEAFEKFAEGFQLRESVEKLKSYLAGSGLSGIASSGKPVTTILQMGEQKVQGMLVQKALLNPTADIKNPQFVNDDGSRTNTPPAQPELKASNPMAFNR